MHSLQIICQQKYYSNYHQISIITSFLGDSAGYIDEENVMDSWRKRSDPKGRIEYRVEIYFLNPIELPDSASIQAPYSGVSAANVMVFRPIISNIAALIMVMASILGCFWVLQAPGEV